MEKIRSMTAIQLVSFPIFLGRILVPGMGAGRSVEEAGGEKTSGIPKIEMNHVKKW